MVPLLDRIRAESADPRRVRGCLRSGGDGIRGRRIGADSRRSPPRLRPNRLRLAPVGRAPGGNPGWPADGRVRARSGGGLRARAPHPPRLSQGRHSRRGRPVGVVRASRRFRAPLVPQRYGGGDRSPQQGRRKKYGTIRRAPAFVGRVSRVDASAARAPNPGSAAGRAGFGSRRYPRRQDARGDRLAVSGRLRPRSPGRHADAVLRPPGRPRSRPTRGPAAAPGAGGFGRIRAGVVGADAGDRAGRGGQSLPRRNPGGRGHSRGGRLDAGGHGNDPGARAPSSHAPGSHAACRRRLWRRFHPRPTRANRYRWCRADRR